MPLNNDFDGLSKLYGETFEFLMTKYAATAGMIGGIHYTPHEVSELLVRIAIAGKKEVNNVYDPTCGPGSSLLYFAKVLGKKKCPERIFWTRN